MCSAVDVDPSLSGFSNAEPSTDRWPVLSENPATVRRQETHCLCRDTKQTKSYFQKREMREGGREREREGRTEVEREREVGKEGEIERAREGGRERRKLAF